MMRERMMRMMMRRWKGVEMERDEDEEEIDEEW